MILLLLSWTTFTYTMAYPTNKSMQNLCKQLGEKMTWKALYTFVKLNRHNVCAALDYSDEKRVTDTDSSDNVNDNAFEPSSSPFQIKYYKTFNVELPFEQIHMIPDKVTYKTNTFKQGECTILKPGTWTNMYKRTLWRQTAAPCVESIRSSKADGLGWSRAKPSTQFDNSAQSQT